MTCMGAVCANDESGPNFCLHRCTLTIIERSSTMMRGGPSQNDSLLQRLLSNKIVKMILAGIIGAMLGAIISLTVNCTLVEISLNPFFSVVRDLLVITTCFMLSHCVVSI